MTYNSIVEYLSLKITNNELAEENAKLHSAARNAYIITDTSTFFTHDSIYNQQYQYIAAKVIANTTNKRNNYLMLNKGRKHGIDNDLAVVTAGGIVGIVNEVSKNFSYVISVLHLRTGISAKIQSNGQLGSLVWDGQNYRKGILKDIPTHAVIIPGDTVVTSGYSHLFPEGILIGTIHDSKIEPGSNFYTITIDFSVDYNMIYYVEVIKNLYKEEQELLEQSSEVD